MLELELELTAAQALDACRGMGLSSKAGASSPAGREPSLAPSDSGRRPARAERVAGKVWVKVHPLRDGGWASDFARELCALRRAASSARQRPKRILTLEEMRALFDHTIRKS